MLAKTGRAGALVICCGLLAMGLAGQAKSKAQNDKKQDKTAAAAATKTPTAGVMAAAAAPPPNTTVVEDVVARVNDKIITNIDYNQAKSDLVSSLQQQAQQSGQTVTPAQIQTAEKNLLSQMIDNDLLVQRATDLGMSAETQTVLELDQLRQQNHLATMEDLQKAVEAQGENYQDFQQSIKNQILQKMVIEQDVAPRVSQPTPAEISAYYNAHKSDFVTADAVGLSEILVSTEGKSAADQKRLQDLADQVQKRAAAGEDFAKLAQRYSNDPSSAQGGDIGFQKRAQLDPKLADALFKLPVGGVTPVEDVPNGFLILKVTGIHHAGQETLAEATSEISYLLYQQKLRPELDTYLAKLRSNAYITVKPGYVDTGASADAGTVDLEKFQRVLPTDLPKPTDKSKQGSGLNVGGGM